METITSRAGVIPLPSPDDEREQELITGYCNIEGIFIEIILLAH